MINKTKQKSVFKALNFLKSSQNTDGSFTSYIDTDRISFKEKDPVKTILNPALILKSLSYAEDENAKEITEKLSSFLEHQRDKDFTYNYWAQDSPNRLKRYCPNDLDDTFCAYIALHSIDDNYSTPEVLVGITKALLATESKVGGPYRTWMVGLQSKLIWLDVDVAVNTNIARYLSMVAQVPKNLQSYLQKMLSNNDLVSPYYPSSLQTLYYMSHLSFINSDDISTKLPSYSEELHPIDLATIAAILLNIGHVIECEPYIVRLLSVQNSDGSWDAGGFSIDRIENGVQHFSGCRELTTAMAIEAITRYSQASSHHKNIVNESSDGVYTQCLLSASAIADKFAPEVSRTLNNYISKLSGSSNGQEIISGALMLENSILNSGASDKLLVKLGCANLFGWIAYTIYDDIIDEGSNTNLLPAANIAQRISLNEFKNSTNNSYVKEYIDKAFNRIDSANTQELSVYRAQISHKSITITHYPDYGDLDLLAERSIGHNLPILIALCESLVFKGSETSVPKNLTAEISFQRMEKALKHYLVAKQLCDDAHDWSEDLENGHMSYTLTRCLSDAGVSPGIYSKKSLHDVIAKQFWHHTVLSICDEISANIYQGERLLTEISFIEPNSAIFEIFNKLKRIVKDTRKEQRAAIAFIKGF